VPKLAANRHSNLGSNHIFVGIGVKIKKNILIYFSIKNTLKKRKKKEIQSGKLGQTKIAN